MLAVYCMMVSRELREGMMVARELREGVGSVLYDGSESHLLGGVDLVDVVVL